ncbi:MAG: hypothetical protein JXQ81_10870, partial [Desulfuromonadales bacterium]|nr:hypothetical protein [Desulfuromonadales bacterium]MBN2793000.1 hypothetical protein [Desulfuromonadales bacterium]
SHKEHKETRLQGLKLQSRHARMVVSGIHGLLEHTWTPIFTGMTTRGRTTQPVMPEWLYRASTTL